MCVSSSSAESSAAGIEEKQERQRDENCQVIHHTGHGGGRCVIFFCRHKEEEEDRERPFDWSRHFTFFAIVLFFSGERLIFFSDDFDAESFELRHTTKLSLSLSHFNGFFFVRLALSTWAIKQTSFNDFVKMSYFFFYFYFWGFHDCKHQRHL